MVQTEEFAQCSEHKNHNYVYYVIVDDRDWYFQRGANAGSTQGEPS